MIDIEFGNQYYLTHGATGMVPKALEHGVDSMHKQSLFKTAKTKAEVWGIPADTYVSVQFVCFEKNVRSGRTEPLYLIRESLSEDWRGHVFGDSALTNFVL